MLICPPRSRIRSTGIKLPAIVIMPAQDLRVELFLVQVLNSGNPSQRDTVVSRSGLGFTEPNSAREKQKTSTQINMCVSLLSYAVIAYGCAECPKLSCGREGCDTEFCYHCRQLWHPNQTCDQARRQRARHTSGSNDASTLYVFNEEPGGGATFIFGL